MSRIHGNTMARAVSATSSSRKVIRIMVLRSPLLPCIPNSSLPPWRSALLQNFSMSLPPLSKGCGLQRTRRASAVRITCSRRSVPEHVENGGHLVPVAKRTSVAQEEGGSRGSQRSKFHMHGRSAAAMRILWCSTWSCTRRRKCTGVSRSIHPASADCSDP